jgi:hypothetical protein
MESRILSPQTPENWDYRYIYYHAQPIKHLFKAKLYKVLQEKLRSLAFKDLEV